MALLIFFMSIIWLPVKGYENRYKISNTGIIIRIVGRMCKKDRELTPYLNDNGYYMIQLHDGVAGKKTRLHRLIAEHFIPNPDNKPYINHINGNKSDNAIPNLEWCTKKENADHATETGLHDIRGSKHFAAKFTEQEIIEIRKEYSLKNIRPVDALKKYSISKGTYFDIVKRRRWKHI